MAAEKPIPFEYPIDGGERQTGTVIKHSPVFINDLSEGRHAGLWTPPDDKYNLRFKREVPLPNEYGETDVTTLVIAKPSGPCQGVLATWEAARESMEIIGGREPVYIHEPLVHSPRANEWFIRNGMTILEDRTPDGDWDYRGFPRGGIYWISAHGSIRPKDALRAMGKAGLVQDFACIKVDAGQNVINAQLRKGMNVVFQGKEGHAETRGSKALIPEGRGGVVTSTEDISKLKLDLTKPTGIHAQTTLSTRQIREARDTLREVIPLTVIRKRGEGCEATDDRQDAVVKLKEEVDAMLVVTDLSSSNGTNLHVRASEERNDGSKIPAIIIPGAEALGLDWRFPPGSGIKKVGVTFSASTDPMDIDLLKEEAEKYGVTIIDQETKVDEGDPYPTPRDNRHLLYDRYNLRLPEVASH